MPEILPLRLKPGTVWTQQGTGLEFVYVPAGSFEMGSNDYHSEKPIHRVTFARGFWIGKYPVTIAQYAQFLQATHHTAPHPWRDIHFNAARQPVVGVDWNDAQAYCQWANDMLKREGTLPPIDGEQIVLPSAAQWEYAARGPESRTYPWGNEPPTRELANFDDLRDRTTPVDHFPQGASWVGALDMAGNVREWCEDHWHENYLEAPHDGMPWTENPSVSGYWKQAENPLNIRVLKGGGWDDTAAAIRPATRSCWRTRDWERSWGFRLAMMSEPS